MLAGTFKSLNAFIRKEQSYQIRYLSFQSKELGKITKIDTKQAQENREDQSMYKWKYRPQIKAKGWLSKNTNKVDQLVIRMTNLDEKERSGIQFSGRTFA